MSAATVERLNAALKGRYAVERELGAGGMATVYLARDVKHDRNVALKVPARELSRTVGVDRFLAEIRTTARLQHPHILPLYDSGEADELLFYVMPLVEGETLRQRLERERRLPVDEATRLVAEVADALAYAHGSGIVHRDIKPENILLANDHALVADFGVSRPVAASGSPRTTHAGELMGTAAYMSPEQAAGDRDLDARSDVFSLGCVLYEMLAGQPPYAGSSVRALITQRFRQPAPSVRERRPEVSHRIDAAIRTAMALEPHARFQSAARFADAIAPSGSASQDAEDARKSIAVLPFTNLSADPDAEFFSDGMAEEILNALVRLPGLRVIARTSSFAFKGSSPDVREVGERLGVGAVLEGSVRKAGKRIRISVRLVDATEGHQLWAESYDREMEDVFSVQDEITGSVRDALSERLLGIGRAQPQARPQIDSATYELFLRGRFFVAKRAEGMQRGMQHLAEVVAKAPDYAPAYAELATAYSILTMYCAVPPRVGWEKVGELADAALQLDPRLARAHAELGNVAFWLKWNWWDAKTHYERAMALDPHDPWVNLLYAHYLASLGQHDEAVAQGERARSLDPLNPSVLTGLAQMQFLARRYSEAVAVCDTIIDQDATFSDALRVKGGALRELALLKEAEAPTEAAVRVSGRHPWMVSLAGMLHAAAGRTKDALDVVAELTERCRSAAAPPFVPPLAVALVLGQLDDGDAYFEWLHTAFEARDPWLVMLRVDPSYHRYHHDRRHFELVERIGIPDRSVLPPPGAPDA
jgi:serine/threonine-protein kinase